MQNSQKAINLLGLAQRAGKLITGTETPPPPPPPSDIQSNTAEKVDRAARKVNVPIINLFTADELSHAISKKRKVLGLTDVGFTKALIKKINEGV